MNPASLGEQLNANEVLCDFLHLSVTVLMITTEQLLGGFKPELIMLQRMGIPAV